MSGYWATYHPYAILFVGACIIAPFVLLGIDMIREHLRAKQERTDVAP